MIASTAATIRKFASRASTLPWRMPLTGGANTLDRLSIEERLSLRGGNGHKKIAIVLANASEPLVQFASDASAKLVIVDHTHVEEAASQSVLLGRRRDCGSLLYATSVSLPDARLDGECRSLRHLLPLFSMEEAFLATLARSALQWHARYVSCPTCGGPLDHSIGVRIDCAGCYEAGGRPDAGHFYQPVSPSVISAIGDANDEHLLAVRAPHFASNSWGCVAGYVEYAECAEEAVAREALEETGVRVDERTVQYVSSQPWPFPHALMLAFVARSVHGAAHSPIVVDPCELEDARWLTIQEVEEGLKRSLQPHSRTQSELRFSPPTSISHFLVREWHARASRRS